MNLSDFQFDVPDELVAQQPASPRDASRLMVLNRTAGTIAHHHFHELPRLLDASYALVVNNSRVIKAKLAARRSDGSPVTIFLLRDQGANRWSCLGDSLAMPEAGERVSFAHSSLGAVFEGERDDGTVTFAFEGVADLSAEIERIGALPLPPYIRETSGEAQYQTVFASEKGSVAAPTAGLHFTPEVFDGLATRGVACEALTLHVGYGTFARVTSERLADHPMHAEAFSLESKVAARLNGYKQAGRRILAVGTTATRVLEAQTDDGGRVHGGSGETNLFVYPPYRWRFVDALLTNFHMPGFSPIMLVAALAGYDLTMRAYREAVNERYRFYSFGDAMLVL